MKCSKCGMQNSDGVKFCGKCGNNLCDVGTNLKNNKNIDSNKLILIILVIISGILIGIGIFILSFSMHFKNVTNNNGSSVNNNNSNIDLKNAFLMPIEDVFTLVNGETIVTGMVNRGSVTVGDNVSIIGLDKEIITTSVLRIEMFRNDKVTAVKEENVGIVLKNVKKDQIQRGQYLIQPNSFSTSKKFDAEIYLLTKDEGGRAKPFDKKYKPQFFFERIEIPGTITLPKGVKKVYPGETIKLTVQLDLGNILEKGNKFYIKENGKNIGRGTITKVY